MRKSAGFTLIELVIVIIILGILGAVAAPRLFNLQGDAYGANLNALKSSISTAATMANAKAQIQGEMGKDVTNIKGYTNNDGLDEPIKFNFGYPQADAAKSKNTGILGTLDNFEYDRYEIAIVGKDPAKLTITPASINKPDLVEKVEGVEDKDISKDACVVIYTEATATAAGTEPVTYTNPKPAKVEAFTGGC